MSKMFSSLLVVLFASALVTANLSKVLIYSATKGYRHDSIPFANEALQNAGPSHGLIFEATENATYFTNASLAKYDAVLFMMTTDTDEDPILDSDQLDAFQDYLNNGGHFVGVHAATVCLTNTKFYEREIGAFFDWHPEFAPATFLNNIEPNHPTVSMIPAAWTFPEEVYSFNSDPRKVGAKVVLTVQHDAKGDSFADKHGTPHPIAWYQERGAGASANATLVGRSFYTSLGHAPETWKDPIFMAHMLAGVRWVLEGGTTLSYTKNATVGHADGFGIPIPSPSTSAPTSPATGAPSGSPTDTVTPSSGQLTQSIPLAFLSFGVTTLASVTLLGL